MPAYPALAAARQHLHIGLHASWGINPYIAMQHQKEHQENMNLLLTNPLLALLLAIWPWHPQARKAKIAGRAVAQVRLCKLKRDMHTIDA